MWPPAAIGKGDASQEKPYKKQQSPLEEELGVSGEKYDAQERVFFLPSLFPTCMFFIVVSNGGLKEVNISSVSSFQRDFLSKPNRTMMSQ